MTDTDEIQVAPGSGFLARPLPFKRRSEWFYNLQQSTSPQRQGRGSVCEVPWYTSLPYLPGPSLTTFYLVSITPRSFSFHRFWVDQ